MAWLANRRSPWLASIGAFIALLGFLPLALYVGQDALFYDIARWCSNPQFVDLAQRWNTTGMMVYYGIVAGAGTVFGPTLLGLALWRSRAIPVWAAICLTFSRLPVLLFSFVPYYVETAIVIAGTMLLFISSIPAALAVVKAPSEGVSQRRAKNHTLLEALYHKQGDITMTFLSIHKLSGNPDDLLQRKHAHMDPVVRRLAPEFGAIMSITARLSDGLVTINLWKSLAFTQHPEVQQALKDSGLPPPTTFDRYTEVSFDDYRQMK